MFLRDPLADALYMIQEVALRELSEGIRRRRNEEASKQAEVLDQTTAPAPLPADRDRPSRL